VALQKRGPHWREKHKSSWIVASVEVSTETLSRSNKIVISASTDTRDWQRWVDYGLTVWIRTGATANWCYRPKAEGGTPY
jgi:hypothetical protein